MNQSDQKFFQSIIKQYSSVVGIDEAGRGPLAGPAVVGAVVYDSEIDLLGLGIKDSKLLSDKKRRQIFEILKNKLIWSVGVVEPIEIDKLGITGAVSLGVSRALKNLEASPEFLMLDGRINLEEAIKIPAQSLIKGDRRFELIGMASIIAKVYRDDMLIEYDKQYPQYNFAQHKGYGTREHYEMLKKFGPCEIHRRSFRLE